MYQPIYAGSAATLLVTNGGNINPPQPGLQVVMQVVNNLTVPVHQAGWKARAWDTWTVTIPFNLSPYVLDPTKAFGIWIKVGAASSATQIVDAVADPGSPAYAANLGPGTAGRALVVGLIEAPALASPPVLEVHGFPRVGETVLFRVRNGGLGSAAVVELGFSNPGNLIGSCRRYTSADFNPPSLPVLTTGLLGDATVPYTWPNDAALLHRHVFVQASVTAAPGTTYTNGLRVTLGGVVP